MFIRGPKIILATAMVHRSSSSGGSGEADMAVFFFGWKF